MAFSSPSSSSSPSSTHKWDVFLSFRGLDTRNNFIAYLYSALYQKGIKTYRDDKNLERGEIISPTLLKAIEESMSSIIVLSPNYASSTWCLEELTKILECKKTKQQIVLPVFYHVDPSEVRNQRRSFGEALTKHQERFKEDPKVQRWKEALQEVASLAGEYLEDGNENEFMEKIIQWVASKIVESTYQLDIVEYPIGLESCLKELNTKLEIGRNDITLIIGIYGTGGIGKTTIAKAIFNSIGKEFEARCFLPNVREISSREEGMVKLQKQLLDDLLGNFGSFNISNVGATNVIKHRLRSKRVLLILDDVNESRQLEELARNKYWFSPGSRIVITTRDQHVLTYHPVDSTYEVQGLDNNQAIQLFSWHAFKRDKPVESYVNLTKCIIGYAKGLPLALEVLGSDLRGRSIQEWESALEKYKRSPHKDIYEILKISYDGLDDNEKDIFLDIACFFKWKSVKYVTKILDSCRFSSSIGIAKLKDKCLININHYHFVEMHDLLQQMGKEIVRQESPKEVGERSRLWFHEDVRHVLEENTGTNKIEAMLLEFPGGHNKICLHPEAFGKMRNLQLFINKNAQFSAGPNYLSNQIRLLEWAHYPSSSLPSNFRGDNLVEFLMYHSLIKELGGLKFENLTNMDLVDCKFLTKIPDLSSCRNLEMLNLANCSSSSAIWKSLEGLELKYCCLSKSNFFIFPRLKYLHLNECKKLEEILPLPLSIVSVQARGCTSLESFALLSEILTKNNGRNFYDFLRIDLYECHNLLVIPSWEEGRQNFTYPFAEREFGIIFPGKGIPDWFCYCKEAHDSNQCEIDINPPHHWNGKDEIIFCVVFGLNPMEKIYFDISVSIHDGSDWKTLCHPSNWTPLCTNEANGFYLLDDANHVWMHRMRYKSKQRPDISNFRFQCQSKCLVFRNVGIHFVKNHEENVRDDIGDHIELDSPFFYYSSDDDENPNEDFEYETDDKNLKEIFGKRRRDDEYDCNMEPNRSPQQKRTQIYSNLFL
ncbi:hypothetical protein I3842_08G151900 [Carya illinoinensis]|uniref:TIR domain-containing protein n=1 Tax=Carya illinoinensis TaxID=32201 RepID=A0A922ECN2_CARIL|nr:hypothetical protein I3842_08G151900 [Carya illinoinensis]